MDVTETVQLTTFSSSSSCYVYTPLPAATSYGHRAELWNPDRWFKEVVLKVVTAGDTCCVRMLLEKGELFAECPLPSDGTSLTTVVEPVVDSSRYFVLKVVDRESRNHAFVGIGFRERSDASDFTAALDDYRQYLRRRREAEQMRQQFDQQLVAAAASGGVDPAAADGAAALHDLSLKQTIRINLASASHSRAKVASSSSSTLQQAPQLQPPGSGGLFKLQPPPPSAAAAAAQSHAEPAKAEPGDRCSAQLGGDDDDEDWSEFVG